MVVFERIQYVAIITILFTLCGFMAYKSEGMRQERVELQMEVKRLERDSIITHELLNNCSTKNNYDIVSEVMRKKSTFKDLENVIKYQNYVIDSLELEIVKYYRSFID